MLQVALLFQEDDSPMDILRIIFSLWLKLLTMNIYDADGDKMAFICEFKGKV
jgi:hypothetical protein